MSKRYCFTNWWLISFVPVLALSLSCSVKQPAPAQEPPGDVVEETAATAEATDADVMYHVFAGELLGTDGDLEKSAAEYLAAAMESEDPAIAERATRVAVAAQSWHYAAMASDRWVLLAPDNLDARQMAIQTLLITGDYVGAEHQMNELLDALVHDPARAWAIITGQLATAANPERADAVLQRLVEERGAEENPDALLSRSQLAARQGRLAEADALATRAADAAPGRADLHAWAGRVAVNVDDEARARRHYRTARGLKPRDASIALAYAELLKRDGRAGEALDELAGLPDAPETRFARVAFALDAGLAADADRIYAGFATAGYSDSPETAFQAARAAELLGRTDQAIDWYARIEDGDRALFAILRRAALLAQRGDLQEARNLLARTRLHRDPEIQRETSLTESRILVNAGQPDAALKVLGDALELLPEDTQLLYSRAMVAVELDRIGLAENDLRSVLQREPDNAAALNALGYTLADRTDRFEEAERLIRAAYRQQPDEASIVDSMGWVAYRLGRLEEAADYLERAWALDNNPEIAAHLGEVLWILGRLDEAREAWRRGLERDAEDRVLLETLARFGVEL